MRHPTEGILRRLVDDPAGVADADRTHVAGCATCLAGLAAVREDAARIGAALEAAHSVDVDAAWHRLQTALPAAGNAPQKQVTGRRRPRFSLRSPVVAALGVGLLLAGAGVAAANDWFQIFHTERVQVVSLQPNQMVGLPD